MRRRRPLCATGAGHASTGMAERTGPARYLALSVSVDDPDWYFVVVVLYQALKW